VSGSTRQLDVLLVSEAPIWPLDQGFRLRGYHMAHALRHTDVRVGVASIEPPPEDMPDELREINIEWPAAAASDYDQLLRNWQVPGAGAIPGANWRQRLARHQGRDLTAFAGLLPIIEQYRPAAVVALGQHGPMMLASLRDNIDTKRVWYAADEMVHHQLSLMRREAVWRWPYRMKLLSLYAMMERLFVPQLQGVIGVNPADTKAFKRIAGAKQAITIRNGVDIDYYRPSNMHPDAKKIVFWGRMDFEPNIDAAYWFATRVFPTLKALVPDVKFEIIGKKPVDKVLQLGRQRGITVLGPVDDLRPHVHSAGIVALPMRCGAGIKNKLLEAAAMGKPIVATHKAIKGLEFDGPDVPLALCHGEKQFVEAICRMWSQPAWPTGLGAAARQWVKRHHSWDQAASSLLSWLNALPGDQVRSIPTRQDRRRPRSATVCDEIETREAA
jgi:glycosyltransferase involved in cell wall biosynthesis